MTAPCAVAPHWLKISYAVFQAIVIVFILVCRRPKWIRENAFHAVTGLCAALKVLAICCYVTDHYGVSIAASLACDALYIFIYSDYFKNGDWKKRWGKLRSSALTFVNRASFQQQSKEAFQ